jgi:hypothetical protein
MSTIDPNKITKIKFKGVTLSGNILSVGVDGIYTYDYNHPQTAYSAANDGDIILIYPGTYSPQSTYTSLYMNRDIRTYVRGMGNSPDDVILTTPSDIWHTICIDNTDATNLFVAMENLKSIANRGSSGAFVHRQCSASTTTILNKLYLSAPSGYTVYFGDTVAYSDYKGNCYITNCSIQRGSYHLREVGAGATTSTISIQKVHYIGGSYSCMSCLRAPSPHDYVTTSTAGYGYLSGESFFEIITIPTYYILSGNSSNYNSIWADSNANINSGKFYAATTGSGAAFSVVDLQNNVVVNNYTIDHMGGGGEFLDSEDIVDINISTLGT